MKEKRDHLKEDHEGCGDKIAEIEGERDAAIEAHAGCEECLAAA